ncbi:unnamed protein product [Gordionus sp. m RMFG-2023]
MVEYNPTFLSIKNLFNDEISNMALSFMQIRNNKHPLFEKTKKLISGDCNIVEMHGLIILLVAKLFGIPKNFRYTTLYEKEQGITQKQRSLSEITQMIYLIRMLHKGIFEFEDKTFDKSIIMGNNLAIISEDYLLACVHRGLAKLEVFEMNNAIADLMVLDFTEYGNIHNLNINFIKDKNQSSYKFKKFGL